MPLTTNQYQTIQNIEERHVTFFLQKAEKQTSLFCMYCKNKLLVLQYEVVMVTPGDDVLHLPVSHKCSNKNCNTHYHFQFPV